MDERTWSVVESFRDFMDEVVSAARSKSDGATQLRDRIEAHIGPEVAQLPIVRLEVPRHQFVNLDVAMAAVVEEQGGGEVVGIGGGDQRHHQTLGDLIQHGAWSAPLGPVDRTRLDTGPDTSREAIAMGVHLFRYAGQPVAVLQRLADPRFGESSSIEVLAAGDVSDPLLSDVRRLMVERSVFRGQLLSFAVNDEMYGPSAGGIAFHARPAVTEADVVLPQGTLARIERHVVGVARHRIALQAAGQHLKRGLLLYGPPGTGKTHTVRYLTSQLPDVTTVILAGNALFLVAAATELAQALQPSLVVIEDVDLVAEHREMHGGPQPLLFTLLDAMDGLMSEADVAFLLTTNRADLLEPALAQRPGRVDLAVEIPLPDRDSRRALLELYGGGLGLSPTALDAAADRTQGVTASFFKELARRVVLTAAETGETLSDECLSEALDEMLSDSEALTRSLLGSGGLALADESLPGPESADFDFPFP